jgi:hypothetical protein
MNSLERLVRTLVTATALALLACSGATFVPAADGGGDDGGNGDASGNGDTGRDPLCPAAAPANGDACATDGLACEYGSDPSPACDIIARCGQETRGRWFVTPAATIGCGVSNPASCPTDYASVPRGQSCSSQISCYYPEARCSCAVSCSSGGFCPAPLDGGMPPSTWQCDLPPENSGCPVPRPRAGDACATPALSCDYGSCSGGVALQCNTGYWQIVGVACPAEEAR